MPACHVKGPFSVRRPLRELQPGPPLNLEPTNKPANLNELARLPYQITTSSVAAGFVEGKNLDDDVKHGMKHFSELDTPKEELPSLIGCGRYWY